MLVARDLDLNPPADGIFGCHSSSPIRGMAVTTVPELPVAFASGVTAIGRRKVEFVFLSERRVGNEISTVTYISCVLLLIL
jgi:hypothetical protein